LGLNVANCVTEAEMDIGKKKWKRLFILPSTFDLRRLFLAPIFTQTRQQHKIYFYRLKLFIKLENVYYHLYNAENKLCS